MTEKWGLHRDLKSNSPFNNYKLKVILLKGNSSMGFRRQCSRPLFFLPRSRSSIFFILYGPIPVHRQECRPDSNKLISSKKDGCRANVVYDIHCLLADVMKERQKGTDFFRRFHNTILPFRYCAYK